MKRYFLHKCLRWYYKHAGVDDGEIDFFLIFEKKHNYWPKKCLFTYLFVYIEGVVVNS